MGFLFFFFLIDSKHKRKVQNLITLTYAYPCVTTTSVEMQILSNIPEGSLMPLRISTILPKQPQALFLAAQIHFAYFWTSYNEVAEYKLSWIWPALLNIPFDRVVHTVAYGSALFFPIVMWCVNVLQFIEHLYCEWAFGLFPVRAVKNKDDMNSLTHAFSGIA